MKRSILFMMAVSAIAVLSCTKEINNETAPEKEKVTMSFDATLGAPTKVELGESNGKGGYKVLWSKGDKIAVFTSDPAAETGSTQKNEFVTDIQSASAQATFSGEIEAADVYYAVYPYESAVYWSEKYDNMTVELPASQTANGIASGISIATADGTSLQFEHVTGYVKFTITNTDIKEVRFSGNNSESLAGQYYVYRDNGETANKLNTYSTLYSTLVLTPAESEEVFTPGTYYFTSFPAELTKGLTLTFVNSSDKVVSKSTDDTKPASIKAGDILNLGTITGLDFDAVSEMTVTFDFTDAASLSLTPAELEDGATAGKGVNIESPVTVSDVTFTPGGAAGKVVLWTKTDKSTELRSYNTGTMTFSVPEGKVITKMVYTGGKIDDSLMSPENGVYTGGTWTGKAQSVTFNVTGTMNITSIVITVDEGAPKAVQTLSFAENEFNVTEGEEFTAPTLSGAMTDVTYSSSSDAVASVDSSTGEVTINGTGTVTITAEAEETEEYFRARASYTIKVDPAAGGYSYTFEKTTFTDEGAQDLGGLNWTLDGSLNTGEGFFGYDSTKGQQFGKGASAYTSMTLTTTAYTNSVGKITVNASGATSIQGSISVTVNGTVYGSTQTLTKTATDYVFNAPQSGAESGTIVISFSQTSSKAIYVKSISIAEAE